GMGRARDGPAAVDREQGGGEGRGRGGQDADAARGPAGGGDSGLQPLGETAARGPIVTAHGDPRRPPQPLPAEGSDPLSDRLRPVGRELVAHDAAAVVLAKNGGGERHGTCPPKRPVGSRRGAGGTSDETAGAARTEAPLTR